MKYNAEERRDYMATIKEIAKLAHVSAATVSRVLNQDETLSVTPGGRYHCIWLVLGSGS